MTIHTCKNIGNYFSLFHSKIFICIDKTLFELQNIPYYNTFTINYFQEPNFFKDFCVYNYLYIYVMCIQDLRLTPWA